MTNKRICSECDNSIVGKSPTAKTCSEACRQKRSRRLRQDNEARKREADADETQRLAASLARGEKDDLARRVVEDELRPVVRSAITQDVLRGIQDLVALTPEVVAAITEDLRSEDPVLRQRAYGLVMKYTLGNAAVAPDSENDGQKLEVHFELPRPGSGETPVLVTAEDVVEERECDMCGNTYPEDKFIDGSDRCENCWAEQRRLVQEQFGE